MKAFNGVLYAVTWVGVAYGQNYQPGNLNVFEMDMYLSQGLTVKLLATAGQNVQYADGSTSSTPMHAQPDGSAVFVDERSTNKGGWVLLSNSEVDFTQGGVGAFYFDKDGNLFEYKMLLTGTVRNCNGGKTQWNTWISCEEDYGLNGKAWQVDPFGVRDPTPIVHGSWGGAWESFAHDTRDPNFLYAFLTEDIENGAVQRMTYSNPDYSNGWDILLRTDGTVDYLFLEPIVDCNGNSNSGTFKWITDEGEARNNAVENYPETEGMEMDGNLLRIISKSLYGFFHLDLDAGTYIFESTGFDGQPDQSTTVFNEDGTRSIYFTEEANPVAGFFGDQVGVYSRNEVGEYTQILFGDDYSSETTGVDFSPDGMHMYFSYQEDGVLFDVTRTDGLSFFAAKLSPPACTGRSRIRDTWDSFRQWLFP